MSSPNVSALHAAVAARVTPRRSPSSSSSLGSSRKKSSVKLGFDVVAEHLIESFHHTVKTKGTTPGGVINTVWKYLKSSCTLSIKGVSKNADNHPIQVTPSNSERTSRSSSSLDSVPSQYSFLRTSESSTNNSSSIQQPHQLDKQFVPFSCSMQAPKRLRLSEVIRLSFNDEVAVFVPPYNKNSPTELKVACESVLDGFRKCVLRDLVNITTAAEREEYFRSELKSREVVREGRVGHEFNVRVCAYPTRDQLTGLLLPSEKRYILNPVTGAGITFQLLGYGPAATTHVKFHWLPFVEFYVNRPPGETIVHDFKLPRSKDDQAVALYLAKELMEVKGDCTALLSLVQQFYQHSLRNEKGKAKADQCATMKQLDRLQSQHEETLKASLSEEVTEERLREFAIEVDACYEVALSSGVTFAEACDHLIRDDVNVYFYMKFKKEFPYLHQTLISIVASKHFKDKDLVEGVDSIMKKQRMVLYIFYCIIRVRSQQLLKHWAIVEPLAHFYKGNQQPDSKSFLGLFTACVDTGFAALDEIYSNGLPAFMNRIESEPVLFGAFDNYQKMIQKKDQNYHKAAITHTGTSYYTKECKPIQLPKWTTMVSPAGVRFKVMSCDLVKGENKFIITGEVYSVDSNASAGVVDADKKLIVEGFKFPRIGWTVTWMPGFQERPAITYHQQIVPPPRMAWVQSNSSDAELAFGKQRRFAKPLSPNSESLSTERMRNVLMLAHRVGDFGTHAKNLKHYSKDCEANVVHDQFCNGMGLVADLVDQAYKFESDLVKHLNPSAPVVDKMFAFPLSSHCETSHHGMMKAYADIAEHLRLLDIDDPTGEGLGRTNLVSTANDRYVHLCVDALSSKMFRHLKYNLTQKSTELGSSQYVDAILDSLERITVQHDYFHEHNMHRQDCIWKRFYGSILQCFQAELRYLRINGDPVKKNVQTHHKFLEIVYRAMKQHRLNCFLAKCGEGYFERMDGEGGVEWLVRIDQAFVSYCADLDDSGDKPSMLCQKLLTMLESYFRCVHAVKKQNFWICEDECVRWMGCYKLCGKTMYVEEGLHRIDTLYGEKMSNYDLELLRCNRFYLMTEGGNAMSLDEVNENLNDWNKQCLKSHTFQTNIDKSKHIMSLRKCGYNSFGTPPTRSSRSVASQHVNVSKLVRLLQRAEIFSMDPTNNREFHSDFFWSLVDFPEPTMTTRDKKKEEVRISASKKHLFDVLCTPEEMRMNDDFEDESGNDDDNYSAKSRVAGNDVRESGFDEDDDESMDEEELESKTKRTLQFLGNVGKRPTSDLLYKDLLGEDANVAMSNIKEKFTKEKERREKRFELIRLVNCHFDKKMESRMSQLEARCKESIDGSWKRRNDSWRVSYREIRADNRKLRRHNPY